MNLKSRGVAKLVGFLFLTACVVGMAAQPLSAQVTIPQGATINSAVFSVYVADPTNQPVTLHRITADWGELSVTWDNFAGHFDSSVVGTFTTDSIGWHTVDLTLLVQAWVNGVPNYGIVMMQVPATTATPYYSSEAAFVEGVSRRPKLDIIYTAAGVVHYVTLQRPGLVQDGVSDSWITERYPYMNNGTDPNLVTGNISGYEKYSLIRFDFTVVPSSPGTGTPGYWMNHPEAWPVPGITIGGIYYSMADAINLMKLPVADDVTLIMFPALVAAKLNVLIGNDASCISSTITSADSWMATYPVGSGVPAKGTESPWRVGEPLYKALDAYNNGLLCAPHRVD